MKKAEKIAAQNKEKAMAQRVEKLEMELATVVAKHEEIEDDMSMADIMALLDNDTNYLALASVM